MYHKVCIYCHKEFESSARGTRYCSAECGVKYRARKTRRRKEYNENRDNNALLNEAYRLSRKVALMYCEKPVGVPDTELELHHKNLNPFDCSPENLLWISRKEHKELHSHLPNVNMVDVLNKVQDDRCLVSPIEEDYVAEVLSSTKEGNISRLNSLVRRAVDA